MPVRAKLKRYNIQTNWCKCAAAAYIQVKRVASVRNISEEKINALVAEQIQKPLLGLFGIQKVNVLKLNIKLDELK